MPNADGRISRDDLEEKFHALQADLQGRLGARKDSILAIGSAVGAVVVILAYLFGKRRGKRKGGRVEIRRF
ncbi:MAG: hypothetical protein EXQ63_00575 [Ilumatobacteraceae bacterium]|nr:hypothetical protein [Ilumatobacteraceae bacterium]